MNGSDDSFISLNQDIINLIKTDELFIKKFDINSNLQMCRDITFRRLMKIIDLQIIDAASILTTPDVLISIMNTLHLYDLSLAIKFGVIFGLFAGALLRYGEPDQISSYLKKLNTGKVIGCLAITEVGHGSNLKKLETAMTFNNDADGFFVNTPTPSANKSWIGNAASNATHAVVLGQLVFNGKSKGLHPFLVKIRNKNHELVKGITIMDNGIKKGLNGVDNGIISFDNVFIKRKKLLRNYGYINKHGIYCIKSEYQNEGTRFGALLSTLSGGRAVLAVGANMVSIKALNISLRYAMTRRQFNFDNGPLEKPIIEYTTHHAKLIPLLAKSTMLQYALNETKKIAIEDFNATNGNITKRIHTLSSGMKILCSEHSEKCCHISENLCGANGYSIENELALMHGDIAIYSRFEGDNTLLRQEVCKNALLMIFEKKKISSLAQLLLFLKFQTEKKFNTIKSYVTVFDINNLDHIKWLLQYRKKYLAFEVVGGLLQHIKNGIAKAEAWNLCLPEVMELADAFMYEKIFGICVDNCINELDKKLLLLFAHDLLNANSTWYLVNNLLCIDDVLRIQKQILSTSKSLSQTQVLTNMLDMFEIPKIFVDVPMIRMQCHL